jgi:hypothetical protein
MRHGLLLGLVATIALSLAMAARADDGSAPQDCLYGAVLSQGTTSISFNSGTATAVVSGWSFCGESTQVAYSWSTGATSQTIAVSAGQCVSVTAYIGTNSNGLAWTQSASGCAPPDGGSSGGTGGSGGTATCGSPSVTGRDSDGDGVDDACDPTPFPYGMSTGPITLQSETDVAGPQRVLLGSSYRNCGGNARLKTRTYKAEWAEAFVPSVTFLRFYVSYEVCYVPSSSIQWAVAFTPDRPYSLIPWTWNDTNDSGFPSTYVTNTSARFQWQGTASICAWKFACTGTRHPGVTITFYPNNTETRNEYAG